MKGSRFVEKRIWYSAVFEGRGASAVVMTLDENRVCYLNSKIELDMYVPYNICVHNFR